MDMINFFATVGLTLTIAFFFFLAFKLTETLLKKQKEKMLHEMESHKVRQDIIMQINHLIDVGNKRDEGTHEALKELSLRIDTKNKLIDVMAKADAELEQRMNNLSHYVETVRADLEPIRELYDQGRMKKYFTAESFLADKKASRKKK